MGLAGASLTHGFQGVGGRPEDARGSIIDPVGPPWVVGIEPVEQPLLSAFRQKARQLDQHPAQKLVAYDHRQMPQRH